MIKSFTLADYPIQFRPNPDSNVVLFLFITDGFNYAVAVAVLERCSHAVSQSYRQEDAENINLDSR